ncbi:60s ribosomal protein l27a-like, partial [Lynx pardinus]
TEEDPKLQGCGSHGDGHLYKHQKHPGGQSSVSGRHQHRVNFDKYQPGYFGK